MYSMYSQMYTTGLRQELLRQLGEWRSWTLSGPEFPPSRCPWEISWEKNDRFMCKSVGKS